MHSRRTTNGGSTSTYPCSRVCRSSMKLIRPRTSLDPAPTNTGKPDPESFAPRARSSRPSVSPSSQCGLPPRGAGSPQVRTTLLCDSSPSGTSGSGRFGTYSSFSSIAASRLRSSTSRVSMRSPSLRRPSRTAVGSSPFSFIRRASPFTASLRSALSWSSWPVSARRRISRASSSSSNRVTVGSPRRASAARTCWGEARNSLRSITTLLLRESGLETAVAAILVDQSLHIQPACRRVHDQHPQLGVERHRRAEQALNRPRADEHHRPRIERDRLVEDVTPGRGELDRVERRRGLLQSGQLAEVDRSRGKQCGRAERVEVEGEIERRRLVHSDGVCAVEREGRREADVGPAQREQRHRVYHIGEDRSGEVRGVAARDDEQGEPGQRGVARGDTGVRRHSVRGRYRAASEWVNPRWLLDFASFRSYAWPPYGDNPGCGRGARPPRRRGRRGGRGA